MEIKELSKILRENGIVGAGGAGFPTYAKLDKRLETIILNCSECEPLLRLHRHLLKKYADEIIRTFSFVADTVGAEEAVIGIKKNCKGTIAAINEVIGLYPKVRLKLLDDVYPVGDEVILIYEITQKVIKPGRPPVDLGVAVFNVETMYNIYRALEYKKPVTSKIVSVVGEVTNPVTVRVPLGCSLRNVVSLAGDITTATPAYLVGGPMMGSIASEEQPVTKTTNAVLVLPKDHPVVLKKNSRTSVELKRASSVCCQCQSCTDLCPRNALGYQIEPHRFMRAAAGRDIQDVSPFINTFFCSSCGLCEMYSCPQGLSPRTLIAECKMGLKKAGIKMPQVVETKSVNDMREFRKIPENRLYARLGIKKYGKDAPLNDEKQTMYQVKILLRQHIGAPAIPVVSTGDILEEGQLIAKPADGLSVAIHASISGKVMEVCSEYVKIQKMSGKGRDLNE